MQVHMHAGTIGLDGSTCSCKSTPLEKADFSAIKSRRNTRLLSERTRPPGKCDPGKISSENLGSPELRSPRRFLRVCTRVRERWTHGAICTIFLVVLFLFRRWRARETLFSRMRPIRGTWYKKRDASPQFFTRANYRRCTGCVTIVLSIKCRREFLKCRTLNRNFEFLCKSRIDFFFYEVSINQGFSINLCLTTNISNVTIK